jgi:hypothetical protein
VTQNRERPLSFTLAGLFTEVVVSLTAAMFPHLRVRRGKQLRGRDRPMGLLLFFGFSILLLWGLLLLTVSAFFRGMAIAGFGATLLHVASNNGFPIWLVAVGLCFLLFPAMTMFRRAIFGE